MTMAHDTGKHNLSQWDPVIDMMGEATIRLPDNLSQKFLGDPQALVRDLAFYKFCAKLSGKNRKIAFFDLSSGLGSWIVSKECGVTVAVLPTIEEAEYAAATWKSEKLVVESVAKVEKTIIAPLDVIIADHELNLLPSGFAPWYNRLSAGGTCIAAIRSDRGESATKLGIARNQLAEIKSLFRYSLAFSMTSANLFIGLRENSEIWIVVGCERTH
jgi:hypothetical protein